MEGFEEENLTNKVDNAILLRKIANLNKYELNGQYLLIYLINSMWCLC